MYMSELSATELRIALENFQTSEFAMPSDPWSLTQQLLQPQWLGHPDATLRDELVYVSLYHLLRGGDFSVEQCRLLLSTITDDRHLFYRFGASGDDSVLTRSFSVQQLPPLLTRHRSEPYFEAHELHQIARHVTKYMLGEQDLRGYDPELGWIHAVAHSADAASGVLRCQDAERETVLLLMTTLRRAAAIERSAYCHGEDERLALAATIGLAHPSLSVTDRTEWLNVFRSKVRECEQIGMPDSYKRLVNVNHTLRALYFLVRKLDREWAAGFATDVSEMLEEFSKL